MFPCNFNIVYKYFPVSDSSFSVPNCSVESEHYCIIQRSLGETIGGKSLKLTNKNLCHRSRVYAIVILFRTFSPQLGNNDTLKLCSNNFSYITYMSPSLFLNCGEKVQKSMKTIGQMFYYFFGSSPHNLRTMIQWNVVLKIVHAWWHICYVISAKKKIKLFILFILRDFWRVQKPSITNSTKLANAVRGKL